MIKFIFQINKIIFQIKMAEFKWKKLFLNMNFMEERVLTINNNSVFHEIKYSKFHLLPPPLLGPTPLPKTFN